jgi:hypothetical protein
MPKYSETLKKTKNQNKQTTTKTAQDALAKRSPTDD